MARRISLLLALLLGSVPVFGGCAVGQPEVPTAAGLHAAAPSPARLVAKAGPDPDQPAFAAPCLEQPPEGAHGRVLNRFVQSGTCVTTVDSDQLTIYFRFTPSVTAEAARAALRITGPVSPAIRVVEPGEWDQFRHLQVIFPAGAPGERLEVRVTGPVGPGQAGVDFGFVLERAPTPGVALQWRPLYGEWRPADRIANLPRQPLQLRFRLQGAVPKEQVESTLTRARLPAGAWVLPDTYELTLTSPPAHLFLDFDSIRTQDDLSTAHSLWEIFTGAPPRLVALDPVTGRDQVIGEAPLNAARGSLSPDGKWAALFTVHPDSLYTEEAWVMDTGTGRQYRLETEHWWPSDSAFWSAAGLVIPTGGMVNHWQPGDNRTTQVSTRSADYVALSPDRRYLAGFTYDIKRESADYLAPGSIVLYDVAARKERLLAVDRIKVRIPHSEFPAYVPMRFTPDGLGLMIRKSAPAGQSTSLVWLRLDLATEALAEVPDYQPEKPPEWTVGAGGYRARLSMEYEPVTVRAPDGTEKSYGEGMAIGWLPDGRLLLVRWENAAHLRRLSSP